MPFFQDGLNCDKTRNPKCDNREEDGQANYHPDTWRRFPFSLY